MLQKNDDEENELWCNLSLFNTYGPSHARVTTRCMLKDIINGFNTDFLKTDTDSQIPMETVFFYSYVKKCHLPLCGSEIFVSLLDIVVVIYQ